MLTVSGEHEVTAARLLRFGHSKDDPTRPQIKVMMGSLNPPRDATVDGCLVG